MSRNILILGASSDVGIRLIEYLNEKEENVTIIAHYNSSKTELEQIQAKKGNGIIPLQANLAEENDVIRLIENVKTNGIPDSIIHLPAPKLQYVKFKDQKWEDCVNDIQIQVGSVYKILQVFLPKMLKGERRAKVVFMLSENTVELPAKFTAKYTMSKYMLLGLLKELTAEYSGKNANINALSPSMINTKLLSNIDRRMLEVSGITDTMLEVDDVLPYIIKLVSKDSDNLFGENIHIPRRQK